MKEFEILISNPWFGLTLSAVSIFIGIVTSHIYYKKGIRDSEKSGIQTLQDLNKANARIESITKELASTKSTVVESYRINQINNQSSSDIKEILTASEKIFVTDSDIQREFEQLYSTRKYREAKNFFIGVKAKIKNEKLKTFLEAMVKVSDGHYWEALTLHEMCLRGEFNNRVLEIHVGHIINIAVNLLADPQRALTIFSTLPSSYIESNDGMLQMARCYLKMHKEDIVIELSERVLSNDENNGLAVRLLALAKAGLGKLDEALVLTERAAILGENFVDINTIKSSIFFKRGDYKQAIETTLQSIAFDKTDKSTEVLIASYINKEDYGSAEILCKTYFNQHPASSNPMILSAYFFILNQFGQHKKVIERSRELGHIELKTDHIALLVSIGHALLSNAQHEEARQKFEFVLSHFPTDLQANLGLIDYYFQTQNKDLNICLALLAQISIRDPSSKIQVLRYYCYIYFEMKNFEKVIQFAHEALKINPNLKDVLQYKEMAERELFRLVE